MIKAQLICISDGHQADSTDVGSVGNVDGYSPIMCQYNMDEYSYSMAIQQMVVTTNFGAKRRDFPLYSPHYDADPHLLTSNAILPLIANVQLSIISQICIVADWHKCVILLSVAWVKAPHG